MNRVDIVRKVLEIQVKVILEVDVNMLLNKFILRDINAYKESLLLWHEWKLKKKMTKITTDNKLCILKTWKKKVFQCELL